MTILPFILKNWDFVSLAIVAMLLLGYDLFIHVRGKEPPSDRSYLVLIVIAIGMLGMHTARESWKEQNITILLDRVGDRLAEEYEADHPYLKEKIAQDLDELRKALQGKKFETSARQSELTRAMESTNHGDRVLAIDHGIDWGGEFQDYQLANEKAIKERGVDIRRIFLLPRSKLPLETREHILANYAKTLPRQANKQIKVWIADEGEALSHKACKFNKYREGSVLFEYKGQEPVVMYEKKRPDELVDGETYHLTVTWDQKDVQERRNLFECLTTEVAKSFSEEEGKALLATAQEILRRDESHSIASR